MELFDFKVTYIPRPFRALSSHTLDWGSRSLSRAVGQENIGFPPFGFNQSYLFGVLNRFSLGFAR